ncbi:MAG: hypothetical protein H6737_21700 [Alphaproteobacteria bacterium]|nr:hypothetical protein [Alphaproteobacteria bacterium]
MLALCALAWGSDLPLPSPNPGSRLFPGHTEISVGTGILQEPAVHRKDAFRLPRASVHLTLAHRLWRSPVYLGAHTAFQDASYDTLRLEPRVGFRIGEADVPFRVDLVVGWSVDVNGYELVHTPTAAVSPRLWLWKRGELLPWFVHVDARIGFLRGYETTTMLCFTPGCNVVTHITPGGSGILWGVGRSFGRVGATR